MLQRLGIGLLGFTALLLFGYVGATPTYAMSKQPGLGFIEQNRIITTFLMVLTVRGRASTQLLLYNN